MTKRERVMQILEDAVFVDGYDDAIIGISEDSYRVVYDLYKMQVIEYENMKNNSPDKKFTFEDACEYIQFSITSAWIGDFTPIYVWMMPKEEDMPIIHHSYLEEDE